MNNHFIILLLFIYVCNVNAQNFGKISKEILKCHSTLDSDPYYDNCYYHLRERTELLKKNHGNVKRDTIFLLELQADLVNQTLYSLIWNKKDTIYYEVEGFNKDAIVLIKKNDTFPIYMCNLVSNWDNEELEKEGKLNSRFIVTEYVNATRIILNKKKYRVDCMRFKFFFNPERDKLDYIPKNKFEQ